MQPHSLGKNRESIVFSTDSPRGYVEVTHAEPDGKPAKGVRVEVPADPADAEEILAGTEQGERLKDRIIEPAYSDTDRQRTFYTDAGFIVINSLGEKIAVRTGYFIEHNPDA